MNYKQTIFFFLLSFSLIGCLAQKKNAKLDLKIDEKNSLTIEGKILENKNSSKDFYILLFKETINNNTKVRRLVHFSTHSKAEPFKINVNPGTYFLYACQNKENITDKRVGYEFNSKKIILNKDTIKKHIIVQMPNLPVLIDEKNILISTTNDYSIFTKFNQTVTTNLNDPIFDRKNASTGLWNPLAFYAKIGGGLYFLEKFSKNKTAILFVHGMSGTPKDFSHIIENIDKNKYQIIMYYYASGANLYYSVDGLTNSIKKIKEKFKIKKLVVIAHSMGGLVSRGFINNINSTLRIEKYITLSTPWNGQKFAAYGGEFASRLVPSFGNMIPGSVFQTNILNKPFAKELKHYLFFGYKGRSSLVLDNSNDGVISLSSQLYSKAQSQADFIFAYDATHSSILKSKEVINQINNILNK